MLARTPTETPSQRLSRAIADAVAKLGPAPRPLPMNASKARGGEYLPEPCSNPRLISSMGYTQNCYCGWPMGAHLTGAA